MVPVSKIDLSFVPQTPSYTLNLNLPDTGIGVTVLKKVRRNHPLPDSISDLEGNVFDFPYYYG